MGQVEIYYLFCLNGGVWIFFTEFFIELSSTFHKTFVKIAEFDLLLERQKLVASVTESVNFRKIFKNLLLKSLGGEANTLHTCF